MHIEYGCPKGPLINQVLLFKLCLDFICKSYEYSCHELFLSNGKVKILRDPEEVFHPGRSSCDSLSANWAKLLGQTRPGSNLSFLQ